MDFRDRTRSDDRGRELAELQRVVALLRNLPDPEPPEGLAERALARIAAEQRDGLLRGGFRRASGSRLSRALAAGVGGLLVYTALQHGRVPDLAPVTPKPTFAMNAVSPVRTVALAASPVRIAPQVFATPASMGTSDVAMGNVVYFGSFPAPAPRAVRSVASLEGRSASIDAGLDRQLNLLMLDPHAFFRRLEQVRSPDRFLDRLAERSARRGDAAEVALRLRSLGRPEARPLVERFLQAALVEYAASH
jgi:hypothetical protein